MKRIHKKLAKPDEEDVVLEEVDDDPDADELSWAHQTALNLKLTNLHGLLSLSWVLP